MGDSTEPHCPTPGGAIHTDCSTHGLDPWIRTAAASQAWNSPQWTLVQGWDGRATPPHTHPHHAYPCPCGHQPQAIVKFSSPALSDHAAVLGAVQPGDWHQTALIENTTRASPPFPGPPCSPSLPLPSTQGLSAPPLAKVHLPGGAQPSSPQVMWVPRPGAPAALPRVSTSHAQYPPVCPLFCTTHWCFMS